MKICILSAVNIKHMTLTSLYFNYFNKMGIDIDIIYIDKYNIVETAPAGRIYRYTTVINRELSKLKKISKYVSFRKFAKNIIYENKYDFIIVWKTETAFLFLDLLIFKYNNKFCLNIRDYTMENNPIFKQVLGKIINQSKFVTISSDGFKRFLPPNKYITLLSYNESLLERCVPKKRMNYMSEPIKVCFIGYVRFFDIDKKLIRALANDNRYIIQYFGEGSQYLEHYCKENKIYNAEFISGFKVEETCKLLEKADVINNLYGKGITALDTAISIKFYYALHRKIPILVFKDTYMEKVSLESGIGYSINDNFNNLADDFYNWYHSQDFENIDKNCEQQIQEIKNNHMLFNNMLNDVFAKVNLSTGHKR